MYILKRKDGEYKGQFIGNKWDYTHIEDINRARIFYSMSGITNFFGKRWNKVQFIQAEEQFKIDGNRKEYSKRLEKAKILVTDRYDIIEVKLVEV